MGWVVILLNVHHWVMMVLKVLEIGVGWSTVQVLEKWDNNVLIGFDCANTNILGLEDIFFGVMILLDVHHWVMVVLKILKVRVGWSTVQVLEKWDINVSFSTDVLDSNILGLEDIFFGVMILLDVHHWVMVVLKVLEVGVGGTIQVLKVWVGWSTVQVLEKWDINVLSGFDCAYTNILGLENIMGWIVILLNVHHWVMVVLKVLEVWVRWATVKFLHCVLFC